MGYTLSTTSNSDKEIYMNYVKAFAIIAMVIGHTHSPFNAFIYQYHMALFMFVSGYFYKDDYSSHPVRLLIKRIKSLYLPFVAYNILFIILSGILSAIGLIDKQINLLSLDTLKGFIKGMLTFNAYAPYLGGFWFVKTLFITTLLFCGISFCINKTKLKTQNKEIFRASIVLMIYVAEWIVLYSGFDIRKNLVQAPMALPIFYIGYLYNRHKDKLKLDIRYAAICLILLFINSHYGTIDMDSLNYENPLFYMVSSVIGCYINIYAAKVLYDKRKKIRYLDFIGSSTYTILAFHLLTKELLYSFLNLFGVTEFYGLWLLDMIIAINISIVLRYTYLKTKNFIKEIRNN